jgi:hypothetical protein
MSRHSWTDISSQAPGRQSVCIAARSACWQQKRVCPPITLAARDQYDLALFVGKPIERLLDG